MRIPLDRGWELTWAKAGDAAESFAEALGRGAGADWSLLQPARSRPIPASVPGCVQLDWARSEGLGPWWQGRNAEDFLWMEDCCWFYSLVLPEVEVDEDQVLLIEAEQAEFRGCVCLGGEEAAGFAGPASGFSIDITEKYCQGARDLLVWLEAAPYREKDHSAAPAGRGVDTGAAKPGMFYGWDFAPRLVPMGLTHPVFLRRAGRTRIESVSVKTWVRPDGRGGAGWIVRLTEPNATVRAVLLDPGGAVVGEASRTASPLPREPGGHAYVSVGLDQVEAWQPNGQGSQPLYTSVLTILDERGRELDQRTFRTGIRTVRLTQYEGQWDEPAPSPVSQREPPVTLEVNGRKIFAKGANWTPPDQLTCLTTPERTRELVQLAKEAGFNLLRVWGGGGAPPESFYDACDEAGILVWQEFPLACAQYEDWQGDVMEGQALAMIERFRTHPSLAFWCGGNELFNSWSRNDDQNQVLRLLNKLTFEEDRERPFLPTSPLMGMGHGGYTFRNHIDGREVHEVFSASRCTAYTEFGCAGAASAEVLRSIIPGDELWPPREGTNWEFHKGLNAWDAAQESWLMLSILRHYFGEDETLEDLVSHSQLLQCEAMRFIYEEARRQAPRCSMALCWCFNEPWPTAANCSIVSWPALPKPAYYAVQAACRATALTLRAPRFAWAPGEEFRAGLVAVHDGPEPFQPLAAQVKADGVLAWEGMAELGQSIGISFVVPEGKKGQTFEVQINDDRPYVFARSEG